MTYEECLRWLYALQPRGIRLELDRMRAACALRGDPQRDLRAIHVAGTNGKGSVSAMIERALRAAGLRTGLYTSPHLHSFRERIRLDGRMIERAEVEARVSELRRWLEAGGAPELTFFEVTTLLAFEILRDARCEVAVMEVGLGGRLDATNVLSNVLVSVITSIGMDHQQYLGHDLRSIAREKLGIVRDGVPVVLGPSMERTFEDEPPWSPVVREPIVPRWIEPASVGALGRVVERIEPQLAGRFQIENAATAAAALVAARERAGLAIDDEAIRRGISEAEWPGRLERIAPDVLVDAAHNVDGARALAEHLRALPRDRPRRLVFGAMADKDWREMLEILLPEVDHLIAVAPPLARAERAAVIALQGGGEAAASVTDGVDAARAAGGLVIVAGSIFVLAAARAHVLGIASEPPIPM